MTPSMILHKVEFDLQVRHFAYYNYCFPEKNPNYADAEFKSRCIFKSIKGHNQVCPIMFLLDKVLREKVEMCVNKHRIDLYFSEDRNFVYSIDCEKINLVKYEKHGNCSLEKVISLSFIISLFNGQRIIETADGKIIDGGDSTSIGRFTLEIPRAMLNGKHKELVS